MNQDHRQQQKNTEKAQRKSANGPVSPEPADAPPLLCLPNLLFPKNHKPLYDKAEGK